MQVVKTKILQRSSDPRSNFIYEQQRNKEHASLSSRFAPTVTLPAITALGEQSCPPPARLGLGAQQVVKRTKVSAFRYFADLDAQSQLAHLQTLQMQGKWADWDAIAGGDLTWQKLLHGCTDAYLKFLLNGPNNSLPTGDNLRRWSNSQVSVRCACCGVAHPTLPHVLNGCKAMLRQGRYTWRHNTILAGLFQAIYTFAQSIEATPLPHITFVRAGEQPETAKQSAAPVKKTGILSRASDWQAVCDLPGQAYAFPEHIATTAQRPDIVLFSNSAKVVVMVELTCPIEDNIDGAYASSKLPRYKNLERDCIAAGWATYCFSPRIGSRGYCAESLKDCLTQLGFDRALTRETIRQVSTTASRSSYLIYCCRNTREWTVPQ